MELALPVALVALGAWLGHRFLAGTRPALPARPDAGPSPDADAPVESPDQAIRRELTSRLAEETVYLDHRGRGQTGDGWQRLIQEFLEEQLPSVAARHGLTPTEAQAREIVQYVLDDACGSRVVATVPASALSPDPPTLTIRKALS